LRELGLLAGEVPSELQSFASLPVLNVRELHVGEVQPVLKLEWDLPLR
jgi:hypothetical protein